MFATDGNIEPNRAKISLRGCVCVCVMCAREKVLWPTMNISYLEMVLGSKAVCVMFVFMTSTSS